MKSIDRATRPAAQDDASNAALDAALSVARRLQTHVRQGGSAEALVASAHHFTGQLKTLHPDRHGAASAAQRQTLEAAVKVLIAARDAALNGRRDDYAKLVAQHAPPALPVSPVHTPAAPMRSAPQSPLFRDVFAEMFGPPPGYLYTAPPPTRRERARDWLADRWDDATDLFGAAFGSTR